MAQQQARGSVDGRVHSPSQPAAAPRSHRPGGGSAPADRGVSGRASPARARDLL